MNAKLLTNMVIAALLLPAVSGCDPELVDAPRVKASFPYSMKVLVSESLDLDVSGQG